MGTAVPRTIEELTPEFLTAALREGGALSSGSVVAVEAQSIGAGAGLFGQLARLRLRYDGASDDAPTSVIAKLPTTNAGNREIGNLFQFYEREIRFYDDLAAHLPLRVPRCHFRVMDVAGDEYLMLMEDLSAATPGDEVAGCVVSAAEIALTALAQHHAVWWEHPKLDELEWMPFVNAPVHQSAQMSYQQAWEPYCQVFGGMLTPYVRDAGDRMKDKIIALLNHFEPRPRTIIHGDYRLDNLFFDHPDGSPIAAIDWQISSRGRGIFDVAYFIVSSLEPDVRRAHEERLVKLWHDIILKSGVTGYALDEAWLDYRIAVLYCNVYTVIGVGSMDAANERGLALQTAWVRRRSAAIEDLRCADVMPA